MNSFTYNGVTLTLPVPPADGFSISKKNTGTISRHSDGARVGYRYSSTDRETFGLVIAPLNKYQIASIKSFLYSTVEGKGIPFIWSDHNGVEKNVVLVNSISSGYVAPSRFFLQLTLEEV